jgi:hypothetical protein
VLDGVGHGDLAWPPGSADVGYRCLQQDVNLGQFGRHNCTLSPASRARCHRQARCGLALNTEKRTPPVWKAAAAVVFCAGTAEAADNADTDNADTNNADTDNAGTDNAGKPADATFEVDCIVS